MTRSPRTPHPSQSAHAHGFSLVELLVAGLLMAISSLGGAYLFNQATRQARTISQTLQRQFEISYELAVIRDRNDRYNCASGSCTVDLENDPPNQEEYAPANPDNPAHTPTFRELCQANLTDNLISHINSQVPKITDADVSREASTDLSATTPPASTPPHRYLVRWSTTDGRVLRQVQLIPTVAAWCP